MHATSAVVAAILAAARLSRLGGATSLIPLASRGQRAAHRLDPSVPDVPAIAAY